MNPVNNLNVNGLYNTLVENGTRIGLHVLGALALWVVGRWLIRITLSLAERGMAQQKVDATAARYAVSTLAGVLNVLLVISILGAFGVQTATFAALVAALGLAIGAALGGLLANFASGFFMVVLRPFKVGDLIEAGGVLGTVVEVGPFATKINTPDNVLVTVGNNKILSDNVSNFSANAYRRVDLYMQLDHDTNVSEVIAALRGRLAAIPNVLAKPAPDSEILEFNLNGPKLAVRPYCHNDHYWQVYFDANRMIRELGEERALAAPAQHVVFHAGLPASNGNGGNGGSAGAPAPASAAGIALALAR